MMQILFLNASTTPGTYGYHAFKILLCPNTAWPIIQIPKSCPSLLDKEANYPSKEVERPNSVFTTAALPPIALHLISLKSIILHQHHAGNRNEREKNESLVILIWKRT